MSYGRSVPKSHISIHSPHARGDVDVSACKIGLCDFNPLPSCEGRLTAKDGLISISDFNPLPSCEGRREAYHITPVSEGFQSTPLMRGETRTQTRYSCCMRHFNPLPSCEGRRITVSSRGRINLFQSTPLMRGETMLPPCWMSILLHFNPLPSCEGRLVNVYISPDTDNFNPLPSCEGRLKRDYPAGAITAISIHSPHARGDQKLCTYSHR